MTVNTASLHLLGAPLFDEGLQQMLEDKSSTMELLCQRLPLLSAQQAVFLLRHSLGAPRVIHLLRCSPAYLSKEGLNSIDEVIMKALALATNCFLGRRLTQKMSLPLRAGGLGVRLAKDLALPCYASSLWATQDLVRTLLPREAFTAFDASVALAESSLREALGGLIGPFPEWTQSNLDRMFWGKTENDLESSAHSEAEKARLNASKQLLSRKWLEVLPSDPVGTLLIDNQFRVGVGLKLGANICHSHLCISCGKLTTATGEHGLSCRHGRGRQLCHRMLNDEVMKMLSKAQIPSMREPTNLWRSDGRRPDGVTLVPWERGKCLVWDATVSDTLAPSYLHKTALRAGVAAEAAERMKKAKYSSLGREYTFVPLAFETLESAYADS